MPNLDSLLFDWGRPGVVLLIVVSVFLCAEWILSRFLSRQSRGSRLSRRLRTSGQAVTLPSSLRKQSGDIQRLRYLNLLYIQAGLRMPVYLFSGLIAGGATVSA